MSETENTQIPILVVAGETSGEVHAAGLIARLREVMEPSLVFFGSGGEQMRAQGVELLLDVSGLAAIGPVAAFNHAHNYLRLFRGLLRIVKRRQPKLAILVDFPDFNLPLARRLKRLGIPVCYFISPQVWAWRQSRVKQIRRFVDLMLVIFPFEEPFFRKAGVEVAYVGNPTARRLSDRRVNGPAGGRLRKVALLPGSRRKEIELILPIQLDAASYIAERIEADFCLVQAPGIGRAMLQSNIDQWCKSGRKLPNLEISEESTDAIMEQADCAVVKSGTSTLEAMLLGVPFAMVYRVSFLNWLLLRPFVRTNTFCLANLVAGRSVAPEFVQWDARGYKIGEYLVSLLTDPTKFTSARAALWAAKSRLGNLDAYQESASRIRTRFFERD